MKILVLSDSHASLRFMRQAMDRVKPDAVIHLGDYYDDGEILAREYPHIPFHQVPGNCDRYRCPEWVKSWLCYDVCGVRLFMAHGHEQGVKLSTGRLAAQARALHAQAALYGHTHRPDCRQEDGLWIFNPGACGSGEGSVGLIVTKDNEILDCRHIDVNSLLATGQNM